MAKLNQFRHKTLKQLGSNLIGPKPKATALLHIVHKGAPRPTKLIPDTRHGAKAHSQPKPWAAEIGLPTRVLLGAFSTTEP